MKKILSKEALEKEASFWSSMKKALEESPAKSCRK
jgi:hypothetical protein